jgi:hypothetical protein
VLRFAFAADRSQLLAQSEIALLLLAGLIMQRTDTTFVGTELEVGQFSSHLFLALQLVGLPLSAVCSRLRVISLVACVYLMGEFPGPRFRSLTLLSLPCWQVILSVILIGVTLAVLLVLLFNGLIYARAAYRAHIRKEVSNRAAFVL